MNKQIEDMAYLIYKNRPIMEMWVDKADAIAEMLYKEGYRKQSEEAIVDYLYEFKSLLINKFIELCNYNDYGKINLLLIGDTIDETFDDVVAEGLRNKLHNLGIEYGKEGRR